MASQKRKREANEKCFRVIYPEIEDEDCEYDDINMFTTIEAVTGRHKKRTTDVIIDQQGKPVYKVNKKSNTW